MSEQAKTNTLLVIVILGISLALGSIVYDVKTGKINNTMTFQSVKVNELWGKFKGAEYMNPDDIANLARSTDTFGGILEVYIAKNDNTYLNKDFVEDDSHFLWEILKEYNGNIYKILDFEIIGNKVKMDIEPYYIDWNKVIK